MTPLVDFDGTMVDVWARYRAVFSACSGIDITEGEYRRLRLARGSDRGVAEALGGSLPESYRDAKREMLEDKAMLELDFLLINAEDLCSWMAEVGGTVLSRRARPEALSRQADALGLGALLPAIRCVGPGETKLGWVERHAGDEVCIMVGDSAEDMAVGALPNVTTTFVGTGLFSEHQASRDRPPDLAFPGLREVIGSWDDLCNMLGYPPA